MIPRVSRPPHHHLRLLARRPMCAPSTCDSTPTARTFNVAISDRVRETASARSTTCTCRCSASTTCRTAWPPSPSPTRWASTTSVIRKALRRLRRRQAPLHPHRRGNGVTVIDDYGHHPVEIAAVLKAARQAGAGQRHRRRAAAPLHPPANLFEDFCTCFNDADMVIVADVYAAGEQPIEGARPRRAGRGPARARPSPGAASPGPKALAEMVRRLAQPGDFVVCLGAGNITTWAQRPAGELQAIYGNSSEQGHDERPCARARDRA